MTKNEFRVVIDAGHGKQDSGAVNGSTGIREKDVVLRDALELRKALEERGVNVILTRGNDIFLTLGERAALANKYKCPLISLHCNASNTKGHGFEAFTSPGKTNSDELATILLHDYEHKVAKKYDLRTRYDLRDGDPDKEARFTVLTKTKDVAVLFELGFIDHAHDEQFLVNTEARKLRTQVMADSIVKWAVKHRGFRPEKNTQKAEDVIGDELLKLKAENAELKAKIKAASKALI